MPKKSVPTADPAPDSMFPLLFEGHPVPMWIYDLETLAFLEVNESAREKYGYSLDEFRKMTLRDIRPAEEIARLEADVSKPRPALQHSGTWLHRLRDGRLIQVEINSHTIPYQGRQAVLVEAADVTEKVQAETRLQQLNRTLAMLNQVNQAMRRLHEPQALFEESCRIAVQTGGFSMAWVGLLDQQARRVKPVASAGNTQDYLEKVEIHLDEGPRGKGPTAEALQSGKAVAVIDILQDERLTHRREHAQRLGFRSLAAFPMLVAGEMFGALNLYSAETGFFTPEVMQLLSGMAADVAFSMEFYRQEQQRQMVQAALGESEERFRTIFEQAAVGVSLVDHHSHRYVNVNQKMCDIIAYTREELLALTFQEITHPDDLSIDIEQLKRLVAGEIKTYTIEKRYLRKDGTSIWVNLTVSPLLAADGSLTSYLSLVEDITPRKQAEARLDEQLAELRRWYAATLGRENRLIELKREVNILLTAAGKPPRYPSVEEDVASSDWFIGEQNLP